MGKVLCYEIEMVDGGFIMTQANEEPRVFADVSDLYDWIECEIAGIQQDEDDVEDGEEEFEDEVCEACGHQGY